MKKYISIVLLAAIAVTALVFTSACSKSENNPSSAASEFSTESTASVEDNTPKDILAGTWKQTDETNGDWEWTFDGKGSCNLKGITTGFESDGKYTLDESAKTITVNIEGWTDQKVYNYTLDDTKLDLEEKYSSYHLIKQ